MCDCKLCTRNRKFKRILATITDPELTQFITTLYEDLNTLEADLDFTNLKLSKFKETQSEAYKLYYNVLTKKG